MVISSKAEIRQAIQDAYDECLPAVGREVTDEQAVPAYLQGWALSRWVFWRKLKFVIEGAALRADSKVLDFGCGTGILLSELCASNRRVYATDLHMEIARAVVRRLGLGRVEFVDPHRWAEVIPDGQMDTVVAANVLEHIENRQDSLRQLVRKLKPDGRLVISGPSENSLYRFGRWLIGFSGHYHVTNVQHVVADALAVGLRPVYRRRWPLPGPMCLYEITAFRRC
jgi:2-polyprenyl-3-methyl-5-hydroxy-6-metoxy-1,4-benzoquinol methylase